MSRTRRINKQALLGRFYRPLARMRSSAPVWQARALVRAPQQFSRLRLNRPYFAADICGTMGAGAMLAYAVILLRHAEDSGLVPVITSSNSLFSRRGEDCISPFLGQAITPAKPVMPLRFRFPQDVNYLGVRMHMPIDRAAAIFARYLQPTPLLAGRLPDTPQFDLAVHYRGTDKHLEAAPVTRDDMLRAIDRHEAAGGATNTIFLATDDPRFEEWFRQRWSGATSFNLAPAVEGPRHYADFDPVEKLIEAIGNILLIARAKRCIRTSSYLSAMSKVVNPALATLTLNRMWSRNTPFPEHELLQAEAQCRLAARAA